MSGRGWWRRRGERRAAVPDPAESPAERLLASGLFDREAYEAQQDRAFDSDQEAADDFVRRSRQRATPHPLVDLLALPRNVREALLAGDPDPLIEHVGTPGATPSPLLAGAESAPLEWLATATPDSPMPGRPGLTWGQARLALVDHHREVGGWRRSRHKRTTREWDAAAEAVWRAEWLARDLPEDTSVSVVMPVRNRAASVGRAIASLQAQTLPTWELVVVDDGSTDDTLAVLHDLAEGDPRVRPVPQEWGGVCAARNRGLAEATGRYVAFLDSDNEWDPDFLRLMVTAMSARDLGAAYAVVAKRDAEGRRYLAHQGDLQDLLVANHIDLNGLVVTREVAAATPGFDPALRRWVDHDFALEVARLTDITLLPFIGVDYEDADDSTDRITTTESDGWQFAVLGKHWARWADEQAPAARRAGLTTVVIAHEGDPRRMLATVAEIADPGTLEVLVVDNGSRRDFSAHAFASLHGLPGVRYVRLPRTLRDSGGFDVGLRMAAGERVVFLDGSVRPRRGWLTPLLAALTDDVSLAGPLVLNKDDSVSAAGLLTGPVPARRLAGHPPEDGVRLPAVTALPLDCLVARTADLLAVGGVDTVFTGDHAATDLALRLPGGCVLVTDARVNRGEDAPSAAPDKEFARRWPDLAPEPDPSIAAVPPSQRWGLVTAAVGGPRGDQWGDTHFAAALAAALEVAGDQPVTYRHLAHARPPRALDDVVLVIRGLDRPDPVPGRPNLLWVISHPDEVDPAELDGFDLVYAASATWAAEMSRRAGREVRFLPQATGIDASRIGVPLGDGSHPVFVGGVHEGRTRPIVHAALDAGLPLTVHGPGWRGLVPEANLGREYVDNRDLPAVYRAAGLVLNDHWPDMAAHGFVSNRLYDAVAAGARVITDPIDGLEAFGGMAQAAATPEDLASLWRDPTRWPTPDDQARVSARICVEHSFAARIVTLRGDVRSLPG